jgi:hypothetical protein
MNTHTTKHFEVDMDFPKCCDVSSDVVQALRQAVDVFATGRSQPVSALSDIESGRKFKPSSSKRQQLTAEEAAEIYKMRPKVENYGKRPKRGSMIRCKSIAPKFGVSAKTIRDIWRGRTWFEATRHLWTAEEKQRRAINGEDQSDSDTEDQQNPCQNSNQLPVAQNSSQQMIPRQPSSLTSNIPQIFAGPAPWVPSQFLWPANQQTPVPQHSGAASSMSPQALQRKITMLKMALSALKATAPPQTMFPSSFPAGPLAGCPPFHPMMNQFVSQGMSGTSFQNQQFFPRHMS